MSKWCKQAYGAICEIFSDDGFCVGDFNISAGKHNTVDITKDEESIRINFTKDKPVIIFRRIIKIKVLLSAIVFDEEGGVIILDFFPDIPFKYEWIENE